jgi:hypothetical protein
MDRNPRIVASSIRFTGARRKTGSATDFGLVRALDY